MTKVIDRDQAIELLKRAVEEKGSDYAYEQPMVLAEDSEYEFPAGCCYFDPTTKAPSCIVGHVLAYIDVAPELVIELGINVDESVPVLAGHAELLGFELTPEAEKVLRAAQRLQDSGTRWGAALANAVSVVAG